MIFIVSLYCFAKQNFGINIQLGKIYEQDKFPL